VRIDIAIVPVVGPATTVATIAIAAVIPPAAAVATAITAARIAPATAIAATVATAVDVDVVEVVIAADGVANVVTNTIPNPVANIVAKAIANTGTIPADTGPARPITGTVAWAIRPVAPETGSITTKPWSITADARPIATDAGTITADPRPVAVRASAADLAGQRRRPVATADARTIPAATKPTAGTTSADLTRQRRRPIPTTNTGTIPTASTAATKPTAGTTSTDLTGQCRRPVHAATTHPATATEPRLRKGLRGDTAKARPFSWTRGESGTAARSTTHTGQRGCTAWTDSGRTLANPAGTLAWLRKGGRRSIGKTAAWEAGGAAAETRPIETAESIAKSTARLWARPGHAADVPWQSCRPIHAAGTEAGHSARTHRSQTRSRRSHAGPLLYSRGRPNTGTWQRRSRHVGHAPHVGPLEIRPLRLHATHVGTLHLLRHLGTRLHLRTGLHLRTLLHLRTSLHLGPLLHLGSLHRRRRTGHGRRRTRHRRSATTPRPTSATLGRVANRGSGDDHHHTGTCKQSAHSSHPFDETESVL